MLASSTGDGQTLPAPGTPILISGAGFAGLASAFWMARLGYAVTIVEAAPGLRRGGTPVDLEGETIGILERIGIVEPVLAKALPPRDFSFKDEKDRTLGSIPTEEPSAARYEIHRDDLLDILFALVRDAVDLRFGCTIRELTQGPQSVDVIFDDGSHGTYALVLGCDGNRSNTRSLVFEGAAAASYFLGGYFYLRVVPETGLIAADCSELFSVAGRAAMLNGYTDRTDLCLAFRSDKQIEYDYRDKAQQRRLVREKFKDLGWKVPAMLAQVDTEGDFYFDQANQIRMEAWSKDRVALVGDAGYCVSPVAGLGGSVALIGAARLAEAMARNPGNHRAAFQEYEATLRPFVEEVQARAATTGMSILFPADQAELDTRNEMLAAGDLPV